MTTAAVEHGHGHGGDAHGHGHGGSDEIIYHRDARHPAVGLRALPVLATVVLFSAFIFAYLYLRSTVDAWPPFVDGHQLPRLDSAVRRAQLDRAVRFGRHDALRAGELEAPQQRPLQHLHGRRRSCSASCSCLAKRTSTRTRAIGGWSGSIFGASFFTLTGMHGFHVFCGVVLPDDPVVQANRGVYDQPELLRPDGRHAVLAFRRRHLGRTVLPVLYLLRRYGPASAPPTPYGAGPPDKRPLQHDKQRTIP